MSRVGSKGSGGGGGGGGSSSSAGGTEAVRELLDAIVKKAGFKQLAGYSIKCLQALIAPSRLGGDILARAAQALGGPMAVLGVLARYPADGELLGFGLSALTAMQWKWRGTGGVPVVSTRSHARRSRSKRWRSPSSFWPFQPPNT